MNKVTIHQGNSTIEFLVKYFHDIPTVIEREFEIPINMSTEELNRLADDSRYPLNHIYIKIMNPTSFNTHIQIDYINLYNQ